MPPNTFAKRLFSLCGLVPLAAFAVLHVAEQSVRVLGAGSSWLEGSEVSSAARVLLFWAPLGYHALYGLKLSLTRRPSEEPDDGPRPVASRPLLDRLLGITGFAALAFILWHTMAFRGATVFSRLGAAACRDELYATLSSTHFGVPLYAAGYLAGLTSIALHLAYGSYTALLRFGVAGSDAKNRRLARILTAASLVWLLVAVSTVWKAATGTVLPF